ncbi:MAG: hypothetical protein ACRETU_08245 [Steroidobacterales bacterium]
MPIPIRYKIEIEAPNGIWRDVRGSDGAILTFDSESDARARLAELYPVETRMEGYGGGKRTRVIRMLPDDDDDWPARRPPA